MAKKAISKIKIRSTGKTYKIKPDGYDDLYDMVCILCDRYGISRPNRYSQNESTSPESQGVPNSGSNNSGNNNSGGESGSNNNTNTQPVENHYAENVAGGELVYITPIESSSSSSPTPLVPFVPDPDGLTFDWEDGDLKVYENGQCMINGNILPLFSKSIVSLVFDSDTFTLGTEEEMVNDISCRYTVIDKHVIPGTYNLKANCGDNTTETVKLNIQDRKFTPKFKDDVMEIRIDRSSEHNFDWQMENNYLGTYMTQSNLITYSLDYFDIPSDCKVDTTEKYLYGKIHLKLNNITEGSPYRNELIGNAVEVVRLASSNGQWCFRDSTWKKDQTDTLTLMFGDVEYDQITVSTYDSTSRVYVRGISDDKFNHTFNVNQEYTLRDLFGFYPYDANFTLIMSSFNFQNYDTSALSFNVVGSTTPNNWKDFYDNYMRVKVLKSGYFTCYVHWKTTDGIGGKMLIYIRGVSDGSGKPSSSSGPLN